MLSKSFNTSLLATATGALIASTAAALLPAPARAACTIDDPTDPFTPCGFLLKASSVIETPHIFGPGVPGYVDTFFITFDDGTGSMTRPWGTPTTPPLPPNSPAIRDSLFTYSSPNGHFQSFFYPNSNLTGTPVTPIFDGSFKIRIIDRPSAGSLGTFNLVVEDATFSTIINGHDIGVRLNPDITKPTVGTITISDNGNGTYNVVSDTLIFAQQVIDGIAQDTPSLRGISNPPTPPNPPTPIPEGSSVGGLLALGFLGVILSGKRRLN